MLFKSSKFYSFITDISESIFRTPTFKIYYNIPILAFCLINFTFPGSKCIHYVIDKKIYTSRALFLCQKHLNSGLESLVFGRSPLSGKRSDQKSFEKIGTVPQIRGKIKVRLFIFLPEEDGLLIFSICKVRIFISK